MAQNFFKMASLKLSTSSSKDSSMNDCSLSPFAPLLELWTMISDFLSDNSNLFFSTEAL